MLFSLEQQALVASCERQIQDIAGYVEKLDQIRKDVRKTFANARDPVAKAKLVFDWLWQKKPFRYQPGGNFRLTDVIDAQNSDSNLPVGNCLGLTVLYNCILQKMRIRTGALYLEHGFGIGPHVLSIVRVGNQMIDIEHILPEGFDYKEHLSSPSRRLWGDKELIADIYHSLGNEYFRKGILEEALKNYSMALELNPHYEYARINKAIVLDMMGNRQINNFTESGSE